MHEIPQWDLIGRLALSALLGSFIGYERERLAWAAGLRTHMLVCVGSTLIMIVSAYGFNDVLTSGVALDPSRMAAQVVSGIGFLGAGAIMARGEVVRGLTTAASVWSVAGIGLAVGGGLYIPAVGATVIILIILAGIKPLERRFISNRQLRSLLIFAERDALTLPMVHEALGASSPRVQTFVMRHKIGSADTDEISITLSRLTEGQFSAVQKRLAGLPGVREIKEADSAP
ncbi:MgtC/SapB family protein [Pseudoduganella sp. FT25W]|jgi:putative Mg2+ transporter-C (MgtC) family protein|uniref:Protein MgtC n=1 Tax=Duganella alba TaxID=2666081 RepID=A0A6L5QGR4_9BURK|nr:MgtC/SapB family protein [Duganella alba]MRX08855.1 MgtC/SapB family protein [Duganella alba]MRX18851.1 MgtC/SapB family protein [Duganella alba]